MRTDFILISHGITSFALSFHDASAFFEGDFWVGQRISSRHRLRCRRQGHASRDDSAHATISLTFSPRCRQRAFNAENFSRQRLMICASPHCTFGYRAFHFIFTIGRQQARFQMIFTRQNTTPFDFIFISQTFHVYACDILILPLPCITHKFMSASHLRRQKCLSFITRLTIFLARETFGAESDGDAIPRPFATPHRVPRRQHRHVFSTLLVDKAFLRAMRDATRCCLAACEYHQCLTAGRKIIFKIFASRRTLHHYIDIGSGQPAEREVR